MSITDLIPSPIKGYATLAGAIAMAAAVAGLAIWHHRQVSQVKLQARAEGLAHGRAELAAYRDQVQQQALQQAAKRQAAQAGLELDRKDIHDEAQRIAALDRARLVAGVRSADAADQRLQQRLDAAAASAAAGGGAVPGGAGPAGQCQAGIDPQARLLGAARRALRQLARDADAELTDVDGRLGECVAQYDAVRQRINALAAP